MKAAANQKRFDWLVLLIGGHSGSGKTNAAKHLGLDLGVPWMMVDDLRLAFQRACVQLPKETNALYFEKTPHFWRRQPEEVCDALVAVGEVLTAPLEVVIENHVDQRIPIVIEGDAILPSLLARTPVAEREWCAQYFSLSQMSRRFWRTCLLAEGTRKT